MYILILHIYINIYISIYIYYKYIASITSINFCLSCITLLLYYLKLNCKDNIFGLKNKNREMKFT